MPQLETEQDKEFSSWYKNSEQHRIDQAIFDEWWKRVYVRGEELGANFDQSFQNQANAAAARLNAIRQDKELRPQRETPKIQYFNPNWTGNYNINSAEAKTEDANNSPVVSNVILTNGVDIGMEAKKVLEKEPPRINDVDAIVGKSPEITQDNNQYTVTMNSINNQNTINNFANPPQPPPESTINWSPKFQNPFDAEVIIGGYNKVKATVRDALDSATENIHFKKDFEEAGKKYNFQFDIGGLGIKSRDDSADQDALLKAKITNYGHTMSDILPWVGSGGLSKGIGTAGKMLLGTKKIAQGSGKVVEVAGKFELSNPFPINGNFARVMSRQQAEQILENGGGKLARGEEAWITAAEDLKGINTIEEVAKKLTLVDENGSLRLSGNAVVEFKLKDMSGINSPYNRTNPGFVNGGRTGSGSREWLIPSDVEITDISIRYLK